MKLILRITILICLSGFLPTSSCKAQLVHIPDAAFRAFLYQNYPFCMVGDSIDPTCSNVIFAQNLDLSYLNITDLSGIEVFTNLSFLDCSDNQIISLPNLPSTLTVLDCSDNNIISLPPLPLSLQTLDCSVNQLTQLPSLTPQLISLFFRKNQITVLPTLPSTLLYLNCDDNQLTSLPILPSALISLECNFNLLSAIPLLPANLKYFECSINLLTSLPALPSSLLVLSCSINQLISLPTLPNSLKVLECDQTQITALPQLPPSIRTISCSNNQLTSLPTLPSSLEILYCWSNSLTSLPILPTNLEDLIVQFNQLTSLPTLPSNLNRLDCSNNQITELPTLPNSLQYLRCNNNLLTSIPELPSTLGELECSSNLLTCLPNLKGLLKLYFSNNQINCVPEYGNLLICTPPITGLPLCDVFNTNGCDIFWNIEGTVYLDADTNCSIGISDPRIYNQQIQLFKNGIADQLTYSNKNGDFDFDTQLYDLYTTKLDTASSLFTIKCPISTSFVDSITAVDSMKYDRDFGLKCKGIDLAATSIFTLSPRPNSILEVQVSAGDISDFFGANCASGVSGTVVISITGSCNYLSPAPGAVTPYSTFGNSLTYNISDFGVLNFDNSFNFIIKVDTNAIAGSQICIQVSISTTSQELNYSNNLLSQCFTIVNSFDPNDKSVLPSTTLDISGDKWLTYTIRFQNTGTAPAEHIYITDTLSSYLDWTSFNLLSYSHQPFTQVYNDGLVKFSFPHIQLPDSTTDEPASHGFVQYKIKAKDSLSIGMQIENTANIFFDFNPPVITNTTYNTIINCSIPSTNIDITICEGQNYQLNNVVYTYSGTYTQKILTTAGCDSTISLNLTVIPKIKNLILSLCDGYNYNFNGQQLSNSGVYYDTLTNVLGCDSIIILNLTFLPLFSTSQSTTICSNDSILFGGVYLNQTGTFTDSLFSIYGCDSVVTLSLSVNSSYNDQQLQTICDGDSVLFGGSWINLPGIYYDSLTTIQGCDSTLVLELLFDTFNNSVSQSNDTLFTSQTGTTYQWLNCNSNIAINGANLQTFSPSQSGNYAVIVSNGLCSDTSNCLFFSATGIGELNAGVLLNSNYSQYDNSIHIRLDGLPNGGVLTLTDLRGRSLQTISIPSDGNIQRQLLLPASNLANGMYLIHLIGEKVDLSAKIVK